MYCERYTSGLLAEPLNSITSIAFLVTAWAIWRMVRRYGSVNVEITVLVSVLVAIGFGSLLYHIFATVWSWVLDVVPILTFQIIYLWLYLRNIIHTRTATAITLAVSFLAVVLLIWALSDALNGSLPYFPALASLIGLGFYHYRHCDRDGITLFGASGVFSFAIFFRSIDLLACKSFQAGTHFIWHLAIALTLYLCARAYISNRPICRD